jgi:DNA-binding CsgD family transcriptional regulator
LKKYIFLFFITLSIQAQLLPPIQSYSPDEYNAANQNWDITQSEEKDIFFANNDGLLKFNGSRWTIYNSPNGSIVRSVKAVKNRVYAGLYEDFGYWEKRLDGKYYFTSLVNSLELIVHNDEEFWNILHYDDWLIFQSLSRLVMYNELSNEIKFFAPSQDIFSSFIVDKRIYFTLNSGLYTLENGKELLVSNDSRLRNRNQYPHILNVFKNEENLLIITDKMDFFELFPNGNLTSLSSSISKPQVNGTTVFKAIRLKDGGFAIGTVGKGLMLFDDKGKLLRSLNKSQGILNNTILSLYEDLDNNIWLGLDNGISLINSKSPFKIYNDKDGVLGTVYSSKLHDDFLYVGTNQGLFFKKHKSTDSFKLIQNTSGQVWSLTEINGELFCGHNNGAFIIKNGIATKIPETSGTWTFRKISKSSNLILEGGYLGFNILYKKNNQWVIRNKIKGFDISSRLFEISKNGKILVSHGYRGVYKLSLSPDFFDLKEIKIDTSVTIGGNASLAKFDNEIYYNYSAGFYKYNTEKDTFEKDNLLSNLSNKELINGIIINDNNKKLWMFSENYLHYLSKDLMSNERIISTVLFPEKLRKTVFENISKIQNDEYIIGTNNGYILFDLEKYLVYPPAIQYEKIDINKINESPISIDFNKDFEFDHKTNNISFYYNSRNFQKFQKVEYQFLLDGYTNDWSSFNEKSNITFSNLRYGNYEFKVRSKIGNVFSKNDLKSIKFSIERPWYISNFMIINYVLIVGIFIFLINRYYINFYRRKEEKIIRMNQNKLELKEIEKKQALTSIKNEKLQQDIEGKNRQLAISTMSMIKKNQFLSKLKKDLKNIDSMQNISSVIRVIDRNLNNKDDWKFFEEAFNNADKDFLKKVKQSHQSLTNNDLRLCAYLRLNLSSKEIAPLLNISLSSVEIKRYRLRKKMNLSRNQRLTDHLLTL